MTAAEWSKEAISFIAGSIIFLKGAEYIPTQVKKHSALIIRFAIRLFIIITVLFPIFLIFYTIYDAKEIDKPLITKIVVNLISFILNLCVQLYFWIKRIKNQVEFNHSIYLRFISGINEAKKED